ncbi:hypothetical protein BDF20DRAFT_885329 [Mycotypha africana]|uniref:uncharacterized protein n=1 Tax=Mycotypha africana TaxID=64632 RepID=UPI0023006D3B|nr:uncharacterized protein BDF20DRAFT_885329 [Mycotypha africana]KAI8971614.1 hypothetical protein BDF20DRAFT_885329 [Mycotypha africana]
MENKTLFIVTLSSIFISQTLLHIIFYSRIVVTDIYIRITIINVSKQIKSTSLINNVVCCVIKFSEKGKSLHVYRHGIFPPGAAKHSSRIMIYTNIQFQQKN